MHVLIAVLGALLLPPAVPATTSLFYTIFYKEGNYSATVLVSHDVFLNAVVLFSNPGQPGAMVYTNGTRLEEISKKIPDAETASTAPACSSARVLRFSTNL